MQWLGLFDLLYLGMGVLFVVAGCCLGRVEESCGVGLGKRAGKVRENEL